MKEDYRGLLDSLEIDPTQGTHLGNNCFKIRLAITSKGKGKSGGSRVIANVRVTKSKVFLLSIFDKSEKENLPDKEIRELLKQIPDLD